jgi:hypothetical protein
VVRLENVVSQGGAILPNTFDIVADNKESVSVQAFDDICEFKEAWNAWECADEFGVLLFDSLDEDRMDRSAQPIYIRNEDLCSIDGTQCFHNRLNAYMDHCWDGFYTCQQREQRFPTMVYQNTDTYWVEYTGTPPEKQMFVLHANNGIGFVVRILYSNAGAYAIYKGTSV